MRRASIKLGMRSEGGCAHHDMVRGACHADIMLVLCLYDADIMLMPCPCNAHGMQSRGNFSVAQEWAGAGAMVGALIGERARGAMGMGVRWGRNAPHDTRSGEGHRDGRNGG